MSCRVFVERKRDVGESVPIENGDTRAVRMDVQLADEVCSKLLHVAPSFDMHRAARMQRKRHIHDPAAVCISVAKKSLFNDIYCSIK